jgi:AbiJ-like protein
MALFPERMGYAAPRTVLQVEGMDEALRTGLWNVLDSFIWSRESYNSPLPFTSSDTPIHELCTALWADYFKKRLDTVPQRWQAAYQELRSSFYKAEWHQVYSFIEFVRARFMFDAGGSGFRSRFDKAINDILEREVAGYRLVSGHIVAITTPTEIAAIEEATKLPASLKVVTEHLNDAIAKLGAKPTGDYRNSIKESISAVEAMCSLIAGQDKANLDAALRVLEKKLELHPALKAAFGKLYGYTSDADGIRHALLEESTLTAEDAIFMLVTCSAFVNYLKALVARAGLQL